MSSLEIASLTGKRHDNVLADIRTMFEGLSLDALSFQGIYHDAYGREKVCFHLNRHRTYTLMTGYSIPMRDKIIGRWMELEEKESQRAKDAGSFHIPKTYAEALRLAASQQDTIESQQKRIEHLEPIFVRCVRHLA